ncbi:hypothetical protein MKZ38_003580 [Zalerion maritima]|uniref:Ran-specific GTPase-activating protein 30 n=1 Tax=Zalerion maritima TaxID=339359 RepID=A0AAD5WRR5_9PEZI|nr:hypothetical protein MKZ38_003580 [Zalerion maritima]
MDALLARLGAQAMNMAIRSGITITSAYAIQQYGRLVDSIETDKKTAAELKSLQKLLDSKIKIISPTIDLIEFKSGRGNVFLESAVPLTKSLHREIINLGRRLENAASESESTLRKTSPEYRQAQLKRVIADIKELLARIDRDIPLLQLAITASGESMLTALPSGVSPSRLLQASTFLIIGDTQFATQPGRLVQIGPSFTLSLYMLFVGHSESVHKTTTNGTSGKGIPSSTVNGTSGHGKQDTRPYGLDDGERKPIWQEVLHKTRVRLCRTPRGFVFDSQHGYHPAGASAAPCSHRNSDWALQRYGSADYFSYFLEIIEDLDDGRVHDDQSATATFQDVEKAGVREAIPIHQIAKIFYTDTGRILNIGNNSDPENNPVLLLKRDVNTQPPAPRTDISGLAADAATSGRVESDPSQDENEDDDDCNQVDIDRQICAESVEAHAPERTPGESTQEPKSHVWGLPPHLDPEWLALEVFADDDGDLSDESDSTVDEENSGDEPDSPHTPTRTRPAIPPRARSSLDSRLIEQIRNISLCSPPRNSSSSSRSRPTSSRSVTTGNMTLARHHGHRPGEPGPEEQESPGAFVSRSPFGAITSSLSLLEMIVRLTSLQEFQQTSHLAIPDHILTFFLEETSTTGLKGQERWRVRTEAKQKVGFDPYMDSPAR